MAYIIKDRKAPLKRKKGLGWRLAAPPRAPAHVTLRCAQASLALSNRHGYMYKPWLSACSFLDRRERNRMRLYGEVANPRTLDVPMGP
jgi:hypothetical protein